VPSQRQLEDAQLLEMIVKIRIAHEFASFYGSPRVWLELRRQGAWVGRKRVERIMREHGLLGAFLCKGWKGGSTKQNPRHTAALDLVDRRFGADQPNWLWVAGLTRVMTGEGVLWLALVRDAVGERLRYIEHSDLALTWTRPLSESARRGAHRRRRRPGRHGPAGPVAGSVMAVR
jgi:putative transposase